MDRIGMGCMNCDCMYIELVEKAADGEPTLPGPCYTHGGEVQFLWVSAPRYN